MTNKYEFLFDEHRFRLGDGLYRADERVNVPPKETELLSLLLTRSGKVVSHREIEAAVWPRQRVSYASLARCVHSLRRILGNDRNKFIETVPKRGYRFVRVVNCSVVAEPPFPAFTQPSKVAIANAHFLEGLRESNRGHSDSQARACRLFRMAAEADPQFIAPLLAESECRGHQYVRGYLPPWEARSLGADACRAALAIAPDSVYARGTLLWFMYTAPGRPAQGARELEMLIRRAPGDARLHFYHSWLLRSIGQLDAAIDAASKAAELDPYSLSNVHALNWVRFMAGGYEEAIESTRTIATRSPWVDVAHAYAALCASMLERHEEAIESGRQAQDVAQGNPTISSVLPYVLARAGQLEEARRVFERLLANTSERMISTHAAAVLAAIGDFDGVAEWLHLAKREACPWFNSVRYDPRFAGCIDDPRILAVLEEGADDHVARHPQANTGRSVDGPGAIAGVGATNRD